MEKMPKPTSKSFHENPDDIFDTEMRFGAVERGVASHNAKMEDEERFGIPDLDESINQDRIRNRIEPPADMVSGREIFRVEAIKQPEGDYEKDLKKLKTLTSNELEKLLEEVEEKSKEGKGLFSKGDLLEGFAIDPETLEQLQSATHDATKFELAAIVVNKLYNLSDTYVDIDNVKERIISGFIYLKVPDFKTPIVKLFLGMKEMGNLVPEKDIERVVSHLKQERKLLPIDSFCKTL